MRRRVQAVLVAALWGGCVAQVAAQDRVSATKALEHGRLVVWLVTPATAIEKLQIALRKQGAAQTLPTTVQERSPSTFGQAASDVGQNAGSYGAPSSDSGRNVTDNAKAASDYGTTPGNFGKAASDHGQAASDTGQTAGSFGGAAGGYGVSTSDLSEPRPIGTSPIPGAAARARSRTAQRPSAPEQLEGTFQAAFGTAHFELVTVLAEEIQDKLAALERPEDYPDVLMVNQEPVAWQRSGLVLATLGAPSGLETPLVERRAIQRWRELKPLIMTKAPRPAEARAFVVWFRDEGLCQDCEHKLPATGARDPARVAASAFEAVLQGNALGDLADPDVAKFSPALARRLALFAGWQAVMDGLEERVDVLRVASNERLAVVLLRGIVSSPQAFGVIHGLAVLRKNDDGQWRVLQITPNISHDALVNAAQTLDEFTKIVAPEKLGHVLGISQAAPVDGDLRQRLPELWWDNGGGAELLVVEWQMQAGEWTDSRMELVEDRNPRLQTRVVAAFARNGAEYRWRVWSVGKGGVLLLSPWRRLRIVP